MTHRLISLRPHRIGRLETFLAMRCPICHREVSWEGNPFRPFCSERCKLIDLDHWLSERYRVSTPVETESESSVGGDDKHDDKGGSG
jgi:endogenous inhibitor of DNA gyrase (YacG/DUF329 family)